MSAALWRGRALALIGIVLLAFSLRTSVASLSPLLDHIAAEVELSSLVVGLIGTAPPVCFAVFGILTPALTARYGLERTTAISLVLITAGLIARGLAPDSLWLLLTTTVTFAGVAIGNVLLPPLVKKHFPDRLGTMMTVYTTMLAVATFLPPLFAVPLADATSWRVSIGLWGVFALLSLVPWVVLVARDRVAAAAPAGPPPSSEPVPEAPEARLFARLWRLPMAWALTSAFATSAILAYVGFAWLPVIFIEHAGTSPAEAGALLSLFAMIGLPSSLIVPVLVVRFHATRSLFLVSTIAAIAGLVGLAYAPDAAVVLWTVLFGCFGILFPLMLVLIGIRARTHESAIALSGFVQSIGYGLSAIFPFLIGVLREQTGGWVVPILVLIASLVLTIPAGLVSARRRTIEDEWERRHGPW